MARVGVSEMKDRGIEVGNVVSRHGLAVVGLNLGDSDEGKLSEDS